MKKFTLLVFCLWILKLTDPSLVQAATLTVDCSGGTAGAYTDLQTAINAAVSGDIITVVGGTACTINTIVDINKSGITIRAQNNYNISPVTAFGSRSNESILILASGGILNFLDGTNNVIFEGFQIQTTTSGVILQLGANHSGITIRNNWYDATASAANSRPFLVRAAAPDGTVNNLLVTNNYIQRISNSPTGASIDLSQGQNITITQNYFALTGGTTRSAIGLGQTSGGTATSNITGNVTVSENYITGITGYGIQLRSKTNSASYTVAFNQIVSNGGGVKASVCCPTSLGVRVRY